MSQDDHLTAGTWTACECGAIDAKDSHNQNFLVSCLLSLVHLAGGILKGLKMPPARLTACIFSQLNPHVSLTLNWNHPFQEYF